MNLPPLTRVWDLPLRRESASYAAALCLCAAPADELHRAESQFLEASELARSARFTAARRQSSYRCGRIAAKAALHRLRPELVATDVAVVEGVFGQPVVTGREAAGLQVTISHADGLGGALAFPELHPMGLDIETIRPELDETIQTQLTPREQALLRTLPLAPSTGCALLWTVKESLSKVLKCGLMTPLTVLEIDEVDAARRTLVSTFTHFGQYRTLSSVCGAHVVSVTLPKHTAATLDFLADSP